MAQTVYLAPSSDDPERQADETADQFNTAVDEVLRLHLGVDAGVARFAVAMLDGEFSLTLERVEEVTQVAAATFDGVDTDALCAYLCHTPNRSGGLVRT